MRVRIWNAYASNNSGSYTIVGWLPSEEVAREVAEKLTAMIEAHTAWYEGELNQGDGSGSPLALFCRDHGLDWSPGDGWHDDWPEHSDDNRPRVAVIGKQVIVHHEYTVSLPAAIGAFFYKRGGRVQSEENHAHHPIVAIASFWWGWTEAQRAQGEIELPRLLAALTAPDGVLMQGTSPMWPAAWRAGGYEFPLTVGVVFENLIDGVAALNEAARRHGARMQVRLHEAPDETLDPLSHMRPSLPPPAVPRFDVVVGNAGNQTALLGAMFEAFGMQAYEVEERLMNVPCTLARCVPAPRAEAIAATLRRAGATVDLVRNDG
jgi:hypothetical protein